jgi:hypothetical protein
VSAGGGFGIKGVSVSTTYSIKIDPIAVGNAYNDFSPIEPTPTLEIPTLVVPEMAEPTGNTTWSNTTNVEAPPAAPAPDRIQAPTPLPPDTGGSSVCWTTGAPP